MIGANDHPIRMQEVVDRRTLAQELRVRHHRDIGSLHGVFDHMGRTNGNRRLIDNNGPRRKYWCDLAGCGFDIGQVSGPVVVLGCRHTQVSKLTISRGDRCSNHKRQSTIGDGVEDQVVEPGFEDRDFAPLQTRHLVSIDIGTHHIVSDVGKTGACRQSDITSANYCNLAHEVSSSATTGFNQSVCVSVGR